MQYKGNLVARPAVSHASLQPNPRAHSHENLSPFLLLNGVLDSYLLFSTTLSVSVAGACLVGAGSALDSWLGEPTASVRAGAPPLPLPAADALPMVAEERGRVGTLSEYSRESTTALRRFCSA